MAEQQEQYDEVEGGRPPATDEDTGEVVDYDDRADEYFESSAEGNTAAEANNGEDQDPTKKRTAGVKRRSDGREGVVINGIIPNVLFISRFARGTTKQDVEDIMSRFGPTSDITVRDTIAFVDFVNEEDAKRAKNELHYHPGLGSDSLIVDYKKDRPQTRAQVNCELLKLTL